MVANNAEFLANEYEYGREVRLSGTGKNRTKTEMVSKEPVHKRPREPAAERSGSQFSPTALLINALEYLFLHEVKQPSLGGHTRKLVNNWTANDRRHRVHAKDN